jgi:hypothetical protein
MTGWEEFIDVVKKFRFLSFAAIGAGGAVPFAAYLADLAPPWPPKVILATAFVEVVGLMLAFQRTFRLARARVTKTLFVLTAVCLSLSLTYLVIFSLFTYTTEPKQERLVGGFICLPEIAQLQEYKEKCPFLGREDVNNGRYEPTKFWYPWTVSLVQIILVTTWMSAFLVFSGLLGTFISF